MTGTLFDGAASLLRELSGPDGILASRSRKANYHSVFARDAVMAGVAGLLLGDRQIVDGLSRTLERLRDLQGAEGQIPSNYEMRGGAVARVSFGSLVPRIDSATWYLVGVALAGRVNAIDPAAFQQSTRAVVRLLDALEYNGRHLIYVPPGGNWADEYVIEGYTLYDQALRAWGLRLAGDLYGERPWLAKATLIEQTIESAFWPDGNGRARDYPIAAFSPTVTRDIFDLAALCILSVAGVATPRVNTTVDWIARRFFDSGNLPPAFDPVIDEDHPDWPALSRYHLHGFRNRPHEYHNGGVWPIWLGWLAVGLARAGRVVELDRLRTIVMTRMAALSHYDFEEYLHGMTGEPGGMAGMAYSATGLILLDIAGSDEQHRLLHA